MKVIKMTSYLPVKIDDEGDYVPIKFGGYQGYKEITYTKKELEETFGKDYQHREDVIDFLVRNEGVYDVRGADRFWVDKVYFDKLKKFIKEHNNHIIVNIDGKDYKIRVKECTRWSRGSGQCFIPAGVLSKFSNEQIYNAIMDAIKMKFGVNKLSDLTGTDIRKLIGKRD